MSDIQNHKTGSSEQPSEKSNNYDSAQYQYNSYYPTGDGSYQGYEGYQQQGYEGYQQGYDGYYQGYDYDYSQYYNDPNYYEQTDYYQTGDYGEGSTTARYSHTFGSLPSEETTGEETTTVPKDGLTAAQRKKLAYYQYYGEDIPEHSTAGYSRTDALGGSPSTPTTTTVTAPPAGGKSKKKGDKEHKKTTILRHAAGETWEDPSLAQWDENDFRLFAGDLGNEVTDELLFKAFAKYPGTLKARVVRDKRTGKSRGYGFISFKDANDFVKAWREMNGKYVGNRPIKLRKSTWKDRNAETKFKKEKERTGPYSKRR
ncbi:uncharacterized protein BX664DRAFT_339041 [Halteromyces radiatus]|uniref:uncharacterized protein n=1 Tax=Halteromyces radiatus TaxID=101107 RepID=UPI00221FD300|nr:uncharacterized protein BX664DRAFT_339041 [Halteromyces radiatus]KAI8082776.1 hypothetical protein BX664DRAFT_339041 [Halteromyces radiatus]